MVDGVVVNVVLGSATVLSEVSTGDTGRGEVGSMQVKCRLTSESMVEVIGEDGEAMVSCSGVGTEWTTG